MRFWDSSALVPLVLRQPASYTLQLGAALVAAYDQPLGSEFVSLDARLSDAANRKGFRVLP